jgi:heme oxygenase (biliverdin-producing, ferredoxin)
MTTSAETLALSAQMREGSQAEHRDAESSEFMERVLAGEVTAADYAQYLAMLRPVYGALEFVANQLADDPIASAVIDEALFRGAALDADLRYWADGAPPTAHSAAVDQYVARILASRNEPLRYLAHHYTRYLGDLSGGQVIGRVLARAHGLGDGEGVAFYSFDAVPKPKPYKDRYRARLDALDLSEQQRAVVVEEVQRVFGLNTALFAELSR